MFYEELGLDIDPGTEAGFRNHYSTEYLIWANDAAKAVLEEDFTGEGPHHLPLLPDEPGLRPVLLGRPRLHAGHG